MAGLLPGNSWFPPIMYWPLKVGGCACRLITRLYLTLTFGMPAIVPLPTAVDVQFEGSRVPLAEMTDGWLPLIPSCPALTFMARVAASKPIGSLCSKPWVIVNLVSNIPPLKQEQFGSINRPEIRRPFLPYVPLKHTKRPPGGISFSIFSNSSEWIT